MAGSDSARGAAGARCEEDDGFLEDDDDTHASEVLRVRMPVGTGRPICVICGQPIDADGHTCTFPEN